MSLSLGFLLSGLYILAASRHTVGFSTIKELEQVTSMKQFKIPCRIVRVVSSYTQDIIRELDQSSPDFSWVLLHIMSGRSGI